jgi:C-terminal processing protease CtpA/Prc
VTAALLALVLWSPAVALAGQTKSLTQQATEAYLRHDYARSGPLFLQAAEAGGDDAAPSFYNAACSFALAGKTDEAFAALDRGVAAGLDDVEQVTADADLTSLRGDARWQPLLDRMAASAKVQRDFWNSPSLQAPYAPNLGEDEKIAGLSKLWSEAKFNFVYFDKLPGLDWDALYLSYLPKVRATSSTLEYYRLLMEMAAQLHDGHTGVWMPDALADETSARPLVRTGRVEGKVMVLAVGDPALKASGVVPGLEVVAIDGLPPSEYARRSVVPYESASTPQDLDARVYGYSLLRGSTRTPVRLELRDASGATMTRTIPRVSRAEYRKSFTSEPMSFAMLPGNVAYVALNTFVENAAAEKFEAAFPEITKADALVIDVRENGGGNSNVGYRVLACLTSTGFVGSTWETRVYRPTLRAWGRRESRYVGEPDAIPANGTHLFTKPVVVLTSPRTYSAAEDFVVAFRAMKRGLLVGEATGGSTGQPLVFALPGGGGARICTKHDRFPDGAEFVGKGVEPDRAVAPTVEDLRAGRDTVLEAALKLLVSR